MGREPHRRWRADGKKSYSSVLLPNAEGGRGVGATEGSKSFKNHQRPDDESMDECNGHILVKGKWGGGGRSSGVVYRWLCRDQREAVLGVLGGMVRTTRCATSIFPR